VTSKKETERSKIWSSSSEEGINLSALDHGLKPTARRHAETKPKDNISFVSYKSKRRMTVFFKDDNLEGYSSGDNNGQFFKLNISELDPVRVDEMASYLWHITFLKLKGALIVLSRYMKFKNKSFMQGVAEPKVKRNSHAKDELNSIDNPLQLKGAQCIILPTNKLK
jgi:hypothetical protein